MKMQLNNQIDDLFFNDIQKECKINQGLYVNNLSHTPQKITLMTNNSHPGKLFEQNLENFSHKNNIFGNFDLNNKNRSISLTNDNKSNNIVSHIFSIFNKSHDEQNKHSLNKDHEIMYSGKNVSKIIQTVIDKKEYIQNVYDKMAQMYEEGQKIITDQKKHFIVNNKHNENILNSISSPIRDMTLKQRLNLLRQININSKTKGEKEILNNNYPILDGPQQEEAFKTDKNDKSILNKKGVNHNSLILPFTETSYIYDASPKENKTKGALNFNVKIKCEERNIIFELKSIHVNNSIKFIKEIIKHKLYKQTNIHTIKSILFIKENKMDENKKIKDFYDDLLSEKEVVCQIEYLNLNIGAKNFKKEKEFNDNSNVNHHHVKTLLPILSKEGYSTNPTYSELCKYDLNMLKNVYPFEIANNLGKIIFLEPVNLVGINIDEHCDINYNGSTIKNCKKREGLNYKRRCITFLNVSNLQFSIEHWQEKISSLGGQMVEYNKLEGKVIYEFQ